jgi:hypothetical protein
MMASAADPGHLELPCHQGIANQGRDTDKAASSLMSVKGSGGKIESLETLSGLLGAQTTVFFFFFPTTVFSNLGAAATKGKRRALTQVVTKFKEVRIVICGEPL